MNKKIIICSLALNAIFFGIFAFNSTSNRIPTNSSQGINSASTGNKVPSARREKFVKADQEIQRYFDSIVLKFEDKRSFVKAFTISSIDMLEVMGLDTNTVTEFQNCRAYLALSADNEFKMYLTPVKNGNDYFLNYKTAATADTNANSYLLDLIAPCPNSCNFKSPALKNKK